MLSHQHPFASKTTRWKVRRPLGQPVVWRVSEHVTMRWSIAMIWTSLYRTAYGLFGAPDLCLFSLVENAYLIVFSHFISIVFYIVRDYTSIAVYRFHLQKRGYVVLPYKHYGHRPSRFEVHGAVAMTCV